MAGLYVGCQKPADINDYLKQFVDELIELSTKGFFLMGGFILLKQKDLSVMLQQGVFSLALYLITVITAAINV